MPVYVICVVIIPRKQKSASTQRTSSDIGNEGWTTTMGGVITVVGGRGERLMEDGGGDLDSPVNNGIAQS